MHLHIIIIRIIHARLYFSTCFALKTKWTRDLQGRRIVTNFGGGHFYKESQLFFSLFLIKEHFEFGEPIEPMLSDAPA